MNISTAAILNILSPKINTNIKEKIDSLSVDGKINIETLAKDKGIQNILSGLFKDISSGAKTKENITSLLQNNKQNFSFKNLTEDIKAAIKSIETNPVSSEKLQTQLSSLKLSLLDMKNIDAKMIKTNLNNSGVFLESKLQQQLTPVSNNTAQILNFLKAQIDITNTTLQTQTNTQNDIKLQTKSAIENILKDIKGVKLETNLQNQSSLLSKIDFAIKTTPNIVSNNLQTTITIDDLDTVKTQLKDQLALINGSLNTNLLQTKVTQLQNNPSVPQDIKLEVKNAVESLLRDFQNIKTEQNPQKTIQQLPLLENKITTLQQNLSNLETKLASNPLQVSSQAVFPAIKSDIVSNLRDLFVNLKDQIINKNFENIKNILNVVEEKITPLTEQNSNAKSIKNDISNIAEQLKNIINNKTNQPLSSLQNIFNNTQAVHTKLENLPQGLFENNISKTANFMSDLKITASTIEETIKNINDPIAKDLKVLVDKINTQIEFYQLLSYSTNSSHTYLSFLQDEIEDADIKFHKSEDDSFSCQINLTLKQYGDLKIFMVLDEKKHININIGLEQEEFKSIVQENMQKLRLGINNIDLMLQSLNVFSLNSSEQKTIKSGYENGADFDFGLDIKV